MLSGLKPRVIVSINCQTGMRARAVDFAGGESLESGLQCLRLTALTSSVPFGYCLRHSASKKTH
eukprot:4581457-Prymnesium_polylepis.1